jgi:hypothetical protein
VHLSRVGVIPALTLALLQCARSQGRSISLQPSELVGTWVLQDFLHSMRAARSPYVAALPEQLQVSSPDQGATWRISWDDGNEGTWYVIYAIKPDTAPGQYVLSHSSGEDAARHWPGADTRFQVQRDSAGAVTAITFLDSLLVESTGRPFVRISAALSTLADGLLAGAYTDPFGHKYTFSDSGIAVWPDRRFHFDVATGYGGGGEVECAYFETTLQPTEPGWGAQRYGFQWRDGKLEILRMLYGPGANEMRCDSVPLLVLRPVGMVSKP